MRIDWSSLDEMPRYRPPTPSLCTTSVMADQTLTFLRSLDESWDMACCRDLMTICGYVMLVAISLLRAPSQKKSRSESSGLAAAGVLPRDTKRIFTSQFLSCSKAVYCSTGLVTSTKAGPIPFHRARTPSFSTIWCRVCKNDLRATTLLAPVVSFCDTRTVWRVLITQMGLLIKAVVIPATRPDRMLSVVVRAPSLALDDRVMRLDVRINSRMASKKK